MRSRPVILAGAGALAVNGLATADLLGVSAVNIGDIGAGAESFRIYLIFDNPLDQLLAVNGDKDVMPLIFDSPTPLIQNNIFEGTSSFDDVPSVADLGGDSWVTIGQDTNDVLDHNTAFSPNFLGGDGMASVIEGTHFEQLDNGGYFDENPGTAALPDENLRILIAQFTLALPSGCCFAYRGTASFNFAGGDLVSRPFMLPAPATLGLLALAGVRGGRRRRRRGPVSP